LTPLEAAAALATEHGLRNDEIDVLMHGSKSGSPRSSGAVTARRQPDWR
jgi:hypothetical protein